MGLEVAASTVFWMRMHRRRPTNRRAPLTSAWFIASCDSSRAKWAGHCHRRNAENEVEVVLGTKIVEKLVEILKTSGT